MRPHPIFHYRTLTLALGIVCGLLLTSCAQLGIPTADTFATRLAVGYSTVTQVRQSATVLLNAQKLTPADGDNVLKSTDAARAGLDVARTISAVDLSAANSKLTAVHTVLTALQAYLASREGG